MPYYDVRDMVLIYAVGTVVGVTVVPREHTPVPQAQSHNGAQTSDNHGCTLEGKHMFVNRYCGLH
jgi:hypothetical protein